VQSAKIRLHALETSNQGGAMYSVSNNFLNTANAWTENGLTANNAPEITGSSLSSVGQATLGQTVEFDVTPAIVGNGTFSFGLKSTSNDAAVYSSKEGGTAPELVVVSGALTKETTEGLADAANSDKLEEITLLPEVLELLPNYPNPFNSETSIEYALPEDTHVKLAIFNVKGQLVRLLFNGQQKAGMEKTRWDGKNGEEKPVGSGVYFLRLDAKGNVFTKRITLQK
jgi:hypothetical protein